tara:strand:- start:768 stop:1706 length:939 start_codon:yes stop_codon:yes gene_type:complete
MAETKPTVVAPVTPNDPITGEVTGRESALSTWAGPYVTEMLGRGQALGSHPWQAYTGPLTAGEAAPQTAAFQGIGSLNVPTTEMGTFAPTSFTDTGIAQQYMNPFTQTALDPQIAEARRQAAIQRVANAGRLTQAGAYGGSRQAIMESETDRNLLRNLADITGRGYETAYDRAQQQYNVEQDRARSAQDMTNQYGLAALTKQAELGAAQRGIESEGLTADYGQFKEERDFPYKQVQYMQSLLQNLPLATQSYSYAEPSTLSKITGLGASAGQLYDTLFPSKPPSTSSASASNVYENTFDSTGNIFTSNNMIS